MAKPIIIVTGANGQVGKELRVLGIHYPHFDFRFLSKEDLAIHEFEILQAFFMDIKPSFCINCAAYTAVDKAETEKELAMLINGDAVGVLAAVCKNAGTKLFHISTDYVFDGTADTPYTESHPTNPVNFYGLTKLKGEALCLLNNDDSIIVRTSWVYSEFGNNFVKTMNRLMKERERISVVNDQIGSPTYAADLARCILMMVEQCHNNSAKCPAGIYNYSNEGIISWYEFAMAVKQLNGRVCHIEPIPASAYPTPAARPSFSVLDKSKIQQTFPEVSIPHWQESLAVCMSHLTYI